MRDWTDVMTEPSRLARLMQEMPWSTLDENIVNVVRFLAENGFETIDSGDGVSKVEGDEPMGCAMAFPNVAIVTLRDAVIDECDRLYRILQDLGVEVNALQENEDGPVGVALQCSYDPANGMCVIVLTGLDDNLLPGGKRENRSDIAKAMAAVLAPEPVCLRCEQERIVGMWDASIPPLSATPHLEGCEKIDAEQIRRERLEIRRERLKAATEPFETQVEVPMDHTFLDIIAEHERPAEAAEESPARVEAAEGKKDGS
jgi:hypothetical protein